MRDQNAKSSDQIESSMICEIRQHSQDIDRLLELLSQMISGKSQHTGAHSDGIIGHCHQLSDVFKVSKGILIGGHSQVVRG